jgi:endoglucanase
MKRILMVLILTGIGISAYAQGLKTSGRKIIDTNGTEVILRGMGLGGWMLQEPYMMEMSDIAGTQWQIKAKIQALIGESNTTAFYDAWHANHCTKGDIDSLASWGFNSVRLPMHYNLYTLPIDEEPVPGENTWLDKGFALTDSLIKWCSDRHLYVILDLHAAPGGQGHDAAISDYDASKLSLWESEANKQKTIALWRKLAERYANEPWVGGYDLINEPNWNFSTGGNINGCSETSNAPLRKLMVDITTAIRQVDQQHMIIIEGNCWGGNYSGIFPTWDNNMVVSFHKYWNNNDQGSIQSMLNLRNQYSVPLWLGESGENSNTWFTDAIQLAESNGIGWAWWPLKKVNSVVNPLTIPKNTGYQALLNYWKNGGTQPSVSFATDALMTLATNSRIENCVFHKDVTDAMFRQIHDLTAKPFTNHAIPGVIHASDYDLGRNNVAYSDTDIANYNGSTGTYTAWNSGWAYRNDGVDIENSTDSDAGSNGYNVGWTADNEWLQYTTEVDSSAAYNVLVRYAYAGAGSKIKLKINNADITSVASLPSSGGNQTWINTTLHDVILYKGSQKLKFVFEKGGINFGYLKFSISKPLSDVAMQPVSAETFEQSQLIYITFNKMLLGPSVTSNGFTCTVNGTPVSFSSMEMNNANPFQIILSLNQEIFDADDIKLNYADSLVKATDGTSLISFSNLQVKNNLPFHLLIPGKIEAEAFSVNQGLELEACSDTGGGQDVGHTNTGDYLDYIIRVATTAKYNMVLRVACLNSAGIVQVQQLNDNGDVLNSANVTVPVTGGWQTWKSVNAEINLAAGIGKLRVKILQPEFNMNWFSFEASQGISDMDTREINIFPNPAEEEITIDIPGSAGKMKTLYFRNLNGTLLMEKALTARESQTINISDLNPGFYIVELEMSGTKFRRKLTIQ